MFRAHFFRSRAGAFTVGMAVAALGLAFLTPVAAPAGAARAKQIAWTPCRDGFQCATVQVPLDYRNPSGGTISMPLIKLPAGDPKHRIGSLLMNPGGPGASGVDLVRFLGPLLPLELRGRFDLIGFDPRGILNSTPLRCFATFDEAINVLPPFAFPYTAAEEGVQEKLDATLAHACAIHGGPIRDHMSSADVARDMDSLRQMLGDSKLNFIGFSYGSYLGQTYANLFPSRVRAIVIDGVLDPVAWSSGAGSEGGRLPVTSRLRSNQGTQATLDEFFRLCDEAGTAACAYAPHSATRFATLIAKLRKAPLTIGTPPDTYTVSYADVSATMLGAMYSPTVWPLVASLLADLESQASASTVLSRFAQLRTRLGLRQPQEAYPNVIEGFPSVLCSDSVNPTTFAAWHRAGVQGDRSTYFGRAWTWASSVCRQWPKSAGQNRYLGPWTARTASPVLVVGNYFDPATRYQGAVKASTLLPNSRLLSYAGWGHTAFLSGNYCIDANVVRYVVTLKTPRKGTVCQPTSQPFEAEPSALAAQKAKAAAMMGLPLMPMPVRQGLTPRRSR
jgi:pimeloyl-ACP methyl ester carboxylesterase